MIFTKESNDAVGNLGEFRLLQQIRSWLGESNPAAPFGMGDDCAVTEPPAAIPQLLTTDALTFGQHFTADLPPSAAGAKLVKRNLSDIAAMGGTPDRALLTLLFGPDLSLEWLREFILGIRETCIYYETRLVGGDISGLEAGRFSSVLALLGHSEFPKTRQSARAGDAIYVTGSLGGSILGKHHSFLPRLAEGRWLSGKTDCGALMDLSDGLAKDLPALLPAETSALLNPGSIPLARDAHRLAEKSGRTPLEHAFRDGEDYELLFTIAADSKPAVFEADWNHAFPHLAATRIGRIVAHEDPGKLFDASSGEMFPWSTGFEHLSNS